MKRHDSFFSSLDRLEKRLKSETKSSSSSASEQLTSSPLYIGIPQPPATTAPLPLEDSSGPAAEFLSSSPPPHPDVFPLPDAEDDDIDRLMDLLHLSTERKAVGGGSADNSCDCSGAGFYSKIAGVRSGRERRRLDGWIDYYYHYRGEGEERREPARLAYLLLAKAACSDGADEHGLGEIGFPSAIQEFLEQDPPSSSRDGC